MEMTNKLYSLDYLQEISGGDSSFVNEMIVTFVENAPIDLNKINELIEQKKWRKAGEEAHRFASSLLFLQLDNLKTIAVDIEEKGINEYEVEQIPQLLKTLEFKCNEIISELKRDFNLL